MELEVRGGAGGVWALAVFGFFFFGLFFFFHLLLLFYMHHILHLSQPLHPGHHEPRTWEFS
jgi:hypothetical protein